MATHGASSLPFGLTGTTSKVRINVTRKQRRLAARRKPARKQAGSPVKGTRRETAPASPGNVSELQALAPAFACWYREHWFRTDVRVVLESLTLFFRFYPASKGSGAITALEPADVAVRLASLILGTLHEGITATYCMMQFLRFLRDSGRWSGDEESFRAVHGILTDIIGLDLRVALRDLQVTPSPRAYDLR